MAATRKRTPPRGLGPCDRLTVDEALAWLGMGDADGRLFLRERGLIKYYKGRRRVLAGELAAADDDSWKREQARRAQTAPEPSTVPRWGDL